VAGTVTNTTDTGKQVSVAYAVGNVNGTYIPSCPMGTYQTKGGS
jgi:hypothetical protein